MAVAATKVRSPNYPSFSLEEAIENARKIHGKDRRNPISREVVAAHMGYSGISGASDKSISNMMQYGLLERVGKGEIRISQLAIDILHPDNDQQYRKALRDSAFMPTLFQVLKGRFGEDHFSDAALRSYLMKQDFNDRAMNPIIRSYSETCSYLKRENAVSGEIESEVEEVETQEPRNEVTVMTTRDAPYTNYQAVPTSSGAGVSVMAGERVVFVEESSPSNYLKLIASGEIDDNMVEALEDYIKRLKKRLAVAAVQSATKPKENGLDEFF